MKLPLIILGAFLLAAVWVLMGRLLFGVFGWMFFVLLLTVVPVIVIYGAVLSLIVAIRQRKVVYRAKGPFMIALAVTLLGLFALGLSVPDGGDTRDSAGSALTVIMGQKSDSQAVNASGRLASWSIFVTLVGAVATFVLAFLERTRRMPDAEPTDNLKPQS
jgi:hypothetical protein